MASSLLAIESRKRIGGAICSISYVLMCFCACLNKVVVRCNLLRFGVKFDNFLLDKNIKKRIICIYNNDIAATRVEL